MKQTTNYQLPQWEETDRIMMKDFNDAMSKIDAALAAMPYVFLRKAELKEDADRLDLDTGGLDLMAYSKVELFIYRPVAVGNFKLLVNNSQSYFNHDHTRNAGGNSAPSKSSVLFAPSVSSGARGTFSLQSHQISGPNVPVAFTTSVIYAEDSTWGCSTYSALCCDVTWDTLTSFNLLPGGSAVKLEAGTTLSLCGIRRF